MTILYADDDKDDRDLFREVLKQIDVSCTIIEARNGLEALKFLSAPDIIPPDLIFLDINMPLLDGIETLVQLRKDARYRTTDVILYSTAENPRISDKKYFNVRFLRKQNTISDTVESLKTVILRNRFTSS